MPSLEVMFPVWRKDIKELRDSGVSDETIRDTVVSRLKHAKESGYTPSEIFVLTREQGVPLRPVGGRKSSATAAIENERELAKAMAEEFGTVRPGEGPVSAFIRGASLGRFEKGGAEGFGEHAAEFAGSLIPFEAARLAVARIPIARTAIVADAMLGGLLGALQDTEAGGLDLKQRLINAAQQAVTFGAFGGILRGAYGKYKGEGFLRSAIGRVGAPTVVPPPSGVATEAPISRALSELEAPPRRRLLEGPPLQTPAPEGGILVGEPRAPSGLRLLEGPPLQTPGGGVLVGKPRATLPAAIDEALTEARASVAEKMPTKTEQIIKAVGTTDAPVTNRPDYIADLTARRGRPRTRLLVPGLTDEQVIESTAKFIEKDKDLSKEQALEMARSIDILDARAFLDRKLSEFRVSSRATTPKGGAPRIYPKGEPRPREVRIGDTLSTESAETINKSLKERTVTFTQTPESISGPTASLSELQKTAELRGYDVRLVEGGYETIGPTGLVNKFESLPKATGFIESRPVKPLQPIELKTEGVSTFDKQVLGTPHNPVDKVNLKQQKIRNRQVSGLKDKLEPAGNILSDNIQNTTIQLDNRTMGSVEDVGGVDVVRALREIREKGFEVEAIKRGEDHYELIYFKKLTPDIEKAIKLYTKSLTGGVETISADNHRFLGTMFGTPAEQTETLIQSLGPQTGRKPRPK